MQESKSPSIILIRIGHAATVTFTLINAASSSLNGSRSPTLPVRDLRSEGWVEHCSTPLAAGFRHFFFAWNIIGCPNFERTKEHGRGGLRCAALDAELKTKRRS